MSDHTPDAENIKGTPKKKREKKPKVPKKITESYLYNSGIYYLQRYVASSAHFERVMLQKVRKSCAHHKDQDFEACAKMVRALVQTLCEDGLLNDEAYTRGMVTSLRRSGKARRIILQKLKMKGIAEDAILRELNAVDEGYDGLEPQEAEFEAALKTAHKKRIGPFAVKEQDYDKSLAKLARAGFSFDICKKVMAWEGEL